MSEANERLFLFQPALEVRRSLCGNLLTLFQPAFWKSAAKRSLCGNLLTLFQPASGSPPQSAVFAAIFSPLSPAPGTRFHHLVSDKIRLHLEIHPYGNTRDQLVLYFQAA